MKQFSVLLTFIFLVVTVYSQNQTRTTFTSPENLLTRQNDNNINWESGFQLPGVPATIVETYENDIIIGGDFSAIGSDTVNSVAIWNTFTERWYKLGNGLKYIDFVGDEFPGKVKDIIVDGIYIYVAGQFNQAINSDGSLVTVDNFAMWDGFEWIPFEANFNAPVEAIELDGFDLYMGG